MPGPRRYRRPTDRITADIVSRFDDFDGWLADDEELPPPSRFDTRAFEPEAAVPDQDPAPVPAPAVPDRAPSIVVAKPEQPQVDDTAERCPTCGVTLPDPAHLVSWARLTAPRP